mgnify:FL=1
MMSQPMNFTERGPMPWRNGFIKLGQGLLRLWRWFNRSFGGLLIGVIILLVFTLVVLQIPAVKQAAVMRLVNQSVEQTQIDLSIGEVEGFFPIQIQLLDLEARIESAAEVSLSQLDIQVQPFPLLFGRTSISSLRLDTLRANISTQELQAWLESNPPSNPLEGSLSIPNVELVDGAFEVTNTTFLSTSIPRTDSASTTNAIRIQDVSLQGRIESDPSLQIVSIESLQFLLPQHSESPFIVTGEWYRDEQRTELNQFDVQHPLLQFSGEVAMDASRNTPLNTVFQQFLYGDMQGSMRWRPSIVDFALFPTLQTPWVQVFSPLTTQGEWIKNGDQWIIEEFELYTQESSVSLSGQFPSFWVESPPLTSPVSLTSSPWAFVLESARLSTPELESHAELSSLAPFLGDVAISSEFTQSQAGAFEWSVDLNEPNGSTRMVSSGQINADESSLTLQSLFAELTFDGFTRELSSLFEKLPTIPGFIRENDTQFGLNLIGQGTFEIDSTILWTLSEPTDAEGHNTGNSLGFTSPSTEQTTSLSQPSSKSSQKDSNLVTWLPNPPKIEATYQATDGRIGRFQPDEVELFTSWKPDSLSGHQITYQVELQGIGLNARSDGFVSFPDWSIAPSASAKQVYTWDQETNVSQWTGSVLDPSMFGTSTDLSFRLSSTIASDWRQQGLAEVALTMREGVFLGSSILPFGASLSKSSRAIVFSSDAFEAAILGEIQGESFLDFTRLVGSSIRDQFAHTYQFEPFLPQRRETQSEGSLESRRYTFEFAMNNGSILAPWVGLERLESQAFFSGSIENRGTTLSLEATAEDSRFVLQNILVTGLEGDIAAQWQLDEPWTSSGLFDWQAQANSIQSRFGSLSNPRWVATLEGQTTTLSLRSEPTNDGLRATLLLSALRNPSTLDIRLDAVDIGRSSYQWSLNEPSRWVYSDVGAWQFEPTTFVSDAQQVQLGGTYSSVAEDAFTLSFQNTDLGDALQFLDSRLEWDATLNGSITTRQLGSTPFLQGELTGLNATLNGRSVGNLRLESRLDSATNRFLVDGALVDTLKESFDIQLQGSLANPLNPVPDPIQLDLTADIQRLDMWLLEELIPTIITQSSGQARGTARYQQIQGQTEFTGALELDSTQLVPTFLNTRLQANGTIQYDLLNGFTLDSIQIADTRGGTGILDGSVGVTSLNPEATIPFDVGLQVESLHLLNNPFDPDIPFFSSITGTGRIELSGTQNGPIISTPQPIDLAQNSAISIPILDVTNIDNNTRFIRFVDKLPSPDEDLTGTPAPSMTTGALIPIQGDSLILSELSRLSTSSATFQDLFTLDLEFRASNPVQAELIFDQVTNDQIRAQGTGDLRLSLLDGDLSVFGSMNITSGDYNFVSGDVLSRQFQLQEGGSISWDGDPYDAELQVSAIYRARPSLASLGSPAGSASESSLGQRVPIELVLDIFGPLTEVQNEFFFQLPSELGGFSDPTLSTRIQSLNQNDEQKLVQAFSLLLTGNFIASGQTTFEDASAFQGVTGSAVLINPFVSQQLISPLLSNQINALFSENITFDVDVNIDAYNEVELGVALRLYNDRLVLRREGQITGNQSSIGDLGAEYRINQLLSLSAFHRQDPTFVQATGSQGSGSSAGETQVMNGVGVQARTEFHTWRELFARLSRGFSTLKWWD